MSPRAYRLGQRQVTTEQTRAKIIEATRELLANPEGLNGFSIEAVARQADVARMTVYYQFSSKTGLLEALCDSLANKGGMGQAQMRNIFMQADPLVGLAELVNIFSRFWEADRLVNRRLRGLAAIDPEFDQVISSRNEGRRKALTVLLQRIESAGHALAAPAGELVNILFSLTSFEFFDSLAGPERRADEVAPTVYRLALAALGLAGTA
ncbi:MAG: TetR/AcrR family transcriptional regulator [Chloroflexi bacterium]|nr:TetR/AcrR family transcriptional regulator [Chloroflexota bacterium]OJV97037.1 MAG: TetR family transcriptional regulator [Chloroflexi bacterium 54-19]